MSAQGRHAGLPLQTFLSHRWKRIGTTRQKRMSVRVVAKKYYPFGKTRWSIREIPTIGLWLVIPASPGPVSGARAGIQSGVLPESATLSMQVPLAWCHGCAQLIRAGTSPVRHAWHQFPLPEESAVQSNKRQARMIPVRIQESENWTAKRHPNPVNIRPWVPRIWALSDPCRTYLIVHCFDCELVCVPPRTEHIRGTRLNGGTFIFRCD